MGDPSLGVPQGKVKPLLDKETIVDLEKEYLEVRRYILIFHCRRRDQRQITECFLLQNMHTNYISWMQKTLDQDVEDWTRDADPDIDNDDCFHTSAPIIVYQMIDENLQVGHPSLF